MADEAESTSIYRTTPGHWWGLMVFSVLLSLLLVGVLPLILLMVLATATNANSFPMVEWAVAQSLCFVAFVMFWRRRLARSLTISDSEIRFNGVVLNARLFVKDVRVVGLV